MKTEYFYLIFSPLPIDVFLWSIWNWFKRVIFSKTSFSFIFQTIFKFSSFPIFIHSFFIHFGINHKKWNHFFEHLYNLLSKNGAKLQIFEVMPLFFYVDFKNVLNYFHSIYKLSKMNKAISKHQFRNIYNEVGIFLICYSTGIHFSGLCFICLRSEQTKVKTHNTHVSTLILVWLNVK